MNKQFKRYGAALTGMALSVPVFAQTTNPLVSVLESIDLAGVATAVGAIVLLIIGITMAFKGGALGKRAIRQV